MWQTAGEQAYPVNRISGRNARKCKSRPGLGPDLGMVPPRLPQGVDPGELGQAADGGTPAKVVDDESPHAGDNRRLHNHGLGGDTAGAHDAHGRILTSQCLCQILERVLGLLDGDPLGERRLRLGTADDGHVKAGLDQRGGDGGAKSTRSL